MMGLALLAVWGLVPLLRMRGAADSAAGKAKPSTRGKSPSGKKIK